MKSITLFSLLISFTLLFSSCFEISEEVNLNNNGSGDVKLTINLSESKQNLAAYLKGGKVEGQAIPSLEELKKEVENIKNALSKVKGMSEVKATTNFEEFVFTLSGKFDKVTTLNKAINKVADELNRSPLPTIKKDNFRHERNQFTRLFKYAKDLKLSPEEFNNLNFSARFVMESARYVSIYRFPKPVKKFSNKKAQLSPSKKAIKLEHTIAELARGEASIENTITY